MEWLEFGIKNTEFRITEAGMIQINANAPSVFFIPYSLFQLQIESEENDIIRLNAVVLALKAQNPFAFGRLERT